MPFPKFQSLFSWMLLSGQDAAQKTIGTRMFQSLFSWMLLSGGSDQKEYIAAYKAFQSLFSWMLLSGRARPGR